MSGIYGFSPSFVYQGQSQVIDLVSEESLAEEKMELDAQPIPSEELGHEPLTNGCDINPEKIIEAETRILSGPLTRGVLRAYKRSLAPSSESSSEERPKKRARWDKPAAPAPSASAPVQQNLGDDNRHFFWRLYCIGLSAICSAYQGRRFH